MGVVDGQALHDSAAVHHGAEGAEGALPEGPREVHQLELDPRVRTVDAVAVHGLGVGDAGEGDGQLHLRGLAAAARRYLLEHREHVLDADEGHLEVHLRELELTICALVLVAEAANDLEVAIEARDHEQLLHDLWRLRPISTSVARSDW